MAPEPARPPAGMVDVWEANLELAADVLDGLQGLLSPDERARAARFHFARDQRRYIAAHGLLRRLLGTYLGCAPTLVRFVHGPHGKPALAPEHSADLHFNMAHSGSLALYAFARGGELGVDVEAIRPEFVDEHIAERFFSTPEVAALRALPRAQQAEAFFNCWTRKEAYLKALGAGLALPLDSFTVALAPGAPAALLEVRDAQGEAARWTLLDLPMRPGYKAALAVPRRPITVSRRGAAG